MMMRRRTIIIASSDKCARRRSWKSGPPRTSEKSGVPRRKSGSSFDSSVSVFICGLYFSSETFGTADSVPLRKARAKAGNGQGRRPHVPDEPLLILPHVSSPRPCARSTPARDAERIEMRKSVRPRRQAQPGLFCEGYGRSATRKTSSGRRLPRREFRRKSKSIRPGTVGACRTRTPRTAPRSTASPTPNAVDTGENPLHGRALGPVESEASSLRG